MLVLVLGNAKYKSVNNIQNVRTKYNEYVCNFVGSLPARDFPLLVFEINMFPPYRYYLLSRRRV